MNEIKSGKGPGVDGFPVECLKKGCAPLLEWLGRLLILKFESEGEIILKHWRVCMYLVIVQRKGRQL